ncbi:dickkopf-related protein 3-like [Dunckerocampus dactyliophorus]|uniref:dickkopf-related protein 3-like n=1 Tax=Dunckerocampus dactyliophorus TaxID=161453 RepID=UPI0024058806|nr:dickkopf-related protein 3-like [Dunckerocampus dactyliophorus]
METRSPPYTIKAGSQAEMSACRVLLSISFSLGLLRATGTAVSSQTITIQDSHQQGLVSLNDMFREVEELMEDTQHILEEAVDQIRTESALDARHRYDNGTNKVGTDSATTAQVLHQTDRETTNKTGETEFPQLPVETSSQWNSAAHECMVDEDCGERKYCLYGIDHSRCLPCIPTDMPCTKDEECCSRQMCVWGQCTINATEGTEGTICQGQSDCRPDLCCAFQRELLFPVCNPKPGKGDYCLNQPNLLMDMLAWDQEGPRDHCPCANDLQCQFHGRGSVCG